MRNEGWNQRTRQRAERLAIDTDAFLLIESHEPVAILPVADRLRERHVFRVGNVIGYAAAFEAGESRRQGDLGHQACVRSAMPDLYRFAEAVDQAFTAIDPVIDGRKAVKQRCARSAGFLNSLLSLLVAVMPRVGVDRGGQHIAIW